jgi:hypothetical protein
MGLPRHVADLSEVASMPYHRATLFIDNLAASVGLYGRFLNGAILKRRAPGLCYVYGDNILQNRIHS